MFVKKTLKCRNIHRKAHVLESLFNKVSGLCEKHLRTVAFVNFGNSAGKPEPRQIEKFNLHKV